MGPNPTNDALSPDLSGIDHEPRPYSRRFWLLSFAAIGVVFGDIGTSPIYAIRECFHGDFGIEISIPHVYGVMSLIFWTLVLVVGVKYLIFVFRAHNHGEGGVIALTALLLDEKRFKAGPRVAVIGLGIFAACLLYGDGMITPAISVLSAVEGLEIIAPSLAVWVIPLTLAILAGLFLLQRHGTAKIGNLFAPVILLWLGFLAVVGVINIVQHPQILGALGPWHAIGFLATNQLHGFLVLGAVFLVVTGTEALFADMGHFGAGPIRFTWFVVVCPALLLNYFGQGAMLLAKPELASHPFYSMVPQSLLVPTVILATFATIIASQAVISGAFSLTSQAIQLGFFPRLKVSHTSASQVGQIYIGPINWMLMICTIGLVLVFRSSSLLAAAYGVAVTSTMLVTSILFYQIARHRWNWNPWIARLLLALFVCIDLPFFGANFSKVLHGAWLPLAIGIVFFAVMWTWRAGRRVLGKKISRLTMPVDKFIAELDQHPPKVIDGTAIFLSGNPDVIPMALVQNIKHNHVLHRQTVVLHFQVADTPRVPAKDKLRVEPLGHQLYRVTAACGFMEEMNLRRILPLAEQQGLKLDLKHASYFLGRERLTIGKAPGLSHWVAVLFLLITRNTSDVSSFFDIPPSQVIEVGVQLEL